ncbi:MAG: family 10 glycosylhydrolase [Defluviitaleaceae bacterium]|nr:family 10 glycosylhydrolase [Defluviitaleaceae bacterium]MCL2835589.1 family 10 glycosylhydrolase [Defluviitaleaceae bacterium]
MRKLFCAAALVMIFLLPGSVKVMAAQEFRAVWVCSVLNLDWPSRPGLSVAEMKSEADYIMDRAAEIGLNAIILQVRPEGDAIYKSDIFPWSRFLTGTQGDAPADGFDPLEYWIEGSHRRGMELHAWINPYRITHRAWNVTDVNTLAPNNPARQNPHLTKVHGPALFYDPGLPAARDLIISGIIEIITNYNVDGIHLDDYFYPARDFNDDDTFAAHGAGWDNKDYWRRESVNTLIADIQQAIRHIRPEARFGISPVGIWRNRSSDPLGSDTRGYEGYSEIFGDSRRWVLEGWVDYICPQIYWAIGHSSADFSTLLRWWHDLARDTGVDLYIGLAAYKEVDGDSAWPAGSGEIMRQLQYMQHFDSIDGHVHFRARHLYGGLGDQIKGFYDNQVINQGFYSPLVIASDLTVVQPRENVTVRAAAGYYMFGAADPNLPVYMNGILVENRTAEGFWSVYAPLSQGDNVFTFTQEGRQSITRTITNREAATPAPPRDPMRINDYAADHPLYATVKDTAIWAFPGHMTTGGSSWLLLPGQKDKVTGMTEDGAWLRLSSGAWVEAKDVDTRTEAALILNPLRDGIYMHDFPDLHSVTWLATEFPATNVIFEDNVLTLYFGMHTTAPYLDIADGAGLDDTIFSSVQSGMDGGTPFYAFTIKPDVNLEGYWQNYQHGAYKFFFKLRKAFSGGANPLSGFVFVLDAGHGGSEPGARGALGNFMVEKDLNLPITQKLAARLEALGAQVHLTRNSDTYVSVFQRTEISRSVKPDMFISVHCDSVAETTDSTNIRGTTIYYRNELSGPAANAFLQNVHTVNPATTRNFGTRTANFYVCRPSWAPSVLVEVSFMNNIHDYSWLLNPENQDAVAAAIVDAVLAYYRD